MGNSSKNRKSGAVREGTASAEEISALNRIASSLEGVERSLLEISLLMHERKAGMIGDRAEDKNCERCRHPSLDAFPQYCRFFDGAERKSVQPGVKKYPTDIFGNPVPYCHEMKINEDCISCSDKALGGIDGAM